MNDAPTVPEATRSAQARQPKRRLRLIFLGSALVVAVLLAGSTELDAPYLRGDEYEFIVDNPNVNPMATGDQTRRSLSTRVFSILASIHGDLYQPLPIITYALEWELTGGAPVNIRRTDLLLHALNGLLLWWALTRLLTGRCGPCQALSKGAAESPPIWLLTWALALLWTLHPALTSTYASEMGRTHLLSAAFALTALLLHLAALERERPIYFVGSLAALILAMLSKVIVGWVAVTFVLEAAYRGGRRALTSPRVYIVGLLCLGFGILSVWTTARIGLMQDSAAVVFGDPLARTGWSIWIHFRNTMAPFWLSVWHLPDPRTGWTYLPVWLGVIVLSASAVHALVAWRNADSRLASLGWVWCWALLLPTSGLVAAREAGADRYLYQPLMGVSLVLATVFWRRLTRAAPATVTGLCRVGVPAVLVLAAAMLLWDMPHCAAARSVLGQATRLVELHPEDPRALEGLALTYDFARNHPLTRADREKYLPPGSDQATVFHALWLQTLHEAAACTNLAVFYPTPADLAAFHRRLSYRFLRAGEPEHSLRHAELARSLAPDEFLTWKRLAHACQALGRVDEAAAAYTECDLRLPMDPLTRAVHNADYAYLLMFELDRDQEACERYVAAATEYPQLPAAQLGLALCHIRYGDGAAGLALVNEVLRTHEHNSLAHLVLAEYHLRSHHWDEAAAEYDYLLRRDPTNYAALRGWHEVCLQLGRFEDAVNAWTQAIDREPSRREFRSYLTWALALADDPSSAEAAAAVLDTDPDNPLACLASMLRALRDGRIDEAVRWVTRARRGHPIPKARPFERAAATLRLLASGGKLPAEAAIIEAAIYAGPDQPESARQRAAALLEEYLASGPPERWRELAESLRGRLSDVPADGSDGKTATTP